MARGHPYRTVEPRDAEAPRRGGDREPVVLAMMFLTGWAALRIGLAPFTPAPGGEVALAALVLTLGVRQLVGSGACAVPPPQPKD